MLKAYWKVTLLRYVLRACWDGEGLLNLVSVIASSLWHLHNQYAKLCGPSLQMEHRGSVVESKMSVYTFLRGVWYARRLVKGAASA